MIARVFSRGRTAGWLVLVLVIIEVGSAWGGIAEDLGAEYEFRRWRAEIDGNRLSLHVAARVIVYAPRGVDYGTLVVSENSFAEFKSARMLVTDTSGRTIRTFSKKHMTKACGFGAVGLYDDVCTYWAELEAAAFPYVVEYEYDLTYHSLFFWQTAPLQAAVPVREASYDLIVPEGFRFHYKGYGVPAEPDVAAEGDKTRYRWTVSGLPASDPPDATPSWAEEYVRLTFIADQFALGEFNLSGISWQSIGDWYRRMAEDRYLPVDGVERPTDIRSAIKTIYDAVTDKTRYVSVQIGVGGWQPHAAALTAERSYGDCKDLTTLLVSRLRQAGIESYPVLVRTKDLGPLDRDFPSLSFNHVIAMAPLGDDTVWMDPTCSTCDLGDLPAGDEQIDVLVVTDTGGVLSATPPAEPTQNYHEQIITLDVEKNAFCTIVCSLRVTGDPARHLRAALSTRSFDEREAYLAALFDLAASQCTLLEWRVAELESRYVPLVITIRARTMRALREIGNTMYINPFLFSHGSLQRRKPSAERTTPLLLDGIGQWRDSVTVRWPASRAIDSIIVPTDRAGEHDGGRFEIRATAAEQMATIVIERVTSAYEVSPSEFASFEVYRENLVTAINQQLKLIGPKD